jgi:hypothetical protein
MSSSGGRTASNGDRGEREDLWTLIDKEPPSAFEGEGGDTTTLFVGDSGCGKSTLINSFLKPNVSKEPKPTFALDYNFARRKASAAKSVAHIWELGGDINEPRLLEVPLTPSALAFTSVVVVCDLSKPQNCLASVLKWVKRVQDVVSLRLRDLQSTDKPAADKLKETAEKKYRGHAGADDKRVRPCEVPLYIVANKYDKFREVPPVWQPFGGSPTSCSSPVISHRRLPLAGRAGRPPQPRAGAAVRGALPRGHARDDVLRGRRAEGLVSFLHVRHLVRPQSLSL